VNSRSQDAQNQMFDLPNKKFLFAVKDIRNAAYNAAEFLTP